MLGDDVDVAEGAVKWALGVVGGGAGGLVDEFHRLDGGTGRVRGGELEVGALLARDLLARQAGLPNLRKGLEEVGAAALEEGFRIGEGDLGLGTFAEQVGGAARGFVGGEVDELVDRTPRDAGGDADFVIGEAGEEGHAVKGAVRDEALVGDGGDVVVRDEDVVDGDVMAAGAAQAADFPGIDDAELVAGDEHLAEKDAAVVLKAAFVAVIDDALTVEPVRVVTAAGEGPLAADAVAALDGYGAAEGVERAANDDVGVPHNLGRAFGREGGAHHAERLDADHERPAGRPTSLRNRFDDADLRFGRALKTANRGGRGDAMQPRFGHGLGGAGGEVSLRFGFVGGLANDGREGAGALDDVVIEGHGRLAGSLELRVEAEDSVRGSRPQAGRCEGAARGSFGAVGERFYPHRPTRWPRRWPQRDESGHGQLYRVPLRRVACLW